MYMQEIPDSNDDRYESLSDIELAVQVAKRIDQYIDEYFLPTQLERPKRAMLGRKLSMSTLDKRLKNVISKNILYQRNDLVHTPEVNTFANPEARAAFIKLSEEVFKELERLISEMVEVDGEDLSYTTSSTESNQSLGLIEALSEQLIKSSPSLMEIIADDNERLLGKF